MIDLGGIGVIGGLEYKSFVGGEKTPQKTQVLSPTTEIERTTAIQIDIVAYRAIDYALFWA